MLRAVAIAVTLLGTITFSNAARADLCKMTETEAYTSTQCVRWLFSCTGRVLGTPDPRFADIPYKVRLRLVAQANYEIAQQKCEHFDYVEAKAAFEGRLIEIDMIP